MNLDFLLNLLFPKNCLGCQKYGAYLCKRCVESIKQTELVCPFCERPSIGGVTHPVCRRRYGLDGLWSLGSYENPLKSAIQKLKYRFVYSLAQDLIDLNLEYWARYTPFILDKIKKDKGDGWLVTSVPLHKFRQNWRGFNQSALLAKIFAEKLGLKYEEALKRTRNTKPQVGLTAHDRKKNIKGAFSLLPIYDKRYTNTLLIDDVWTTGSTLKECCYVLKRSGVKVVWALTLAR